MKTFHGWIRLLVLAAWVPWVVAPPALGSPVYVRDVRTESPTVRESRHRRIVERRAGPIVIVHRGASAMAPENSLEAYSAAMDYGADGCEIDLRCTRGGVSILFHDDLVDHLLNEVGEIRELTFAELTGVRPRLRRGRVLPCSGPPTLALFSQDLTGEQMRALLGHAKPAVRGTAILECLDRPTRRRTQALKAVAPWALELPRARLCPTTP